MSQWFPSLARVPEIANHLRALNGLLRRRRAPASPLAARLIAFALPAVIAGCAHLGGGRMPVPRPAPVVLAIPGLPVSLQLAVYRHVIQRPLLGGALVCAGGDVMLGSNLDTAWARRARRLMPFTGVLPSPDSLLAPLHDLVADADVVLVNVEGAIGNGPSGRKCRPRSTRCYAFRQEVAAAGALRRLAPRAQVVGNVANNHAADAGAAGLEHTVAYLRDAGVEVVGADTLPALVPLPDGDTLAVLGFSTFSVGADARDLAAVRRHVAWAATRYRRVIVSVHMGAEGVGAQRTRDASEQFAGEDRGNPVAFGRAAVEGGAAIVFGHGPHVPRAIEWREDALVVYSLGNLLTFGPFSLAEPMNRGGFVCATLSGQGGVLSAELRATRQEAPGRAVADGSGRVGMLVDSLSALDFPLTGARVVDGQLRRR
jgi:hypothetical protein